MSAARAQAALHRVELDRPELHHRPQRVDRLADPIPQRHALRAWATTSSRSSADDHFFRYAVDVGDLTGADRRDVRAGDDDADEVERIGRVQHDAFAGALDLAHLVELLDAPAGARTAHR